MMRNRGDTDFFYKQFAIGSAGESNLLVNTRFNTTETNNTYTSHVVLRSSDMDKRPFAAKTLQLQVMNAN